MLRWRASLAAIAVITSAALYAQVPTGEALPPGSIADRVIVDKSARILTLLREDRVLKTYPMRVGRNPSGPKTREGDGRTPEGMYRIDYRNPRSRFHLALHVSYPSRTDAQRAAAAGLPPGGDIMIHGLPNGFGWLGRLYQLFDWTDGCIAVTDREIEEIYRAVPDGTPIEFRA